MKECTISLHRLGEQYLQNTIPFGFSIMDSVQSFYVQQEENKKYVQPIFKIGETNTPDGDIPNVICISAAGATGKSELSKYLSTHYQSPIFNLSKHDPVASNSLTGVLVNSLGFENASKYVNQLRDGQSFLIIDAVDEGFLKTTADGYDSFLDDIASISKGLSNTCIIILGRTQAIEHTYLYLDDKDVKTLLLTIETFTIKQAKEFIDKQLGIQNYQQQYQIVRDYIIDTIEGFFKNESEIKKAQYLSFIGYAPVLLSISMLLSKEKNYKKLHEDLLSTNNKHIDLIITIIELILKRDKTEKIDTQLLPGLLDGRSPEFIEIAKSATYSIDEQCYRILSYIMSKQIISLNVTGDTNFDTMYEEKIGQWIKEHPFIENKRIQNAVFESYIITKLINNRLYRELAYEYLRTQYKDAFMLFFIYDKLSQDRFIDIKTLPYLYASIKSLDNTEYLTNLSIDEIEFSDDYTVLCDISFRLDNNDFDYRCRFHYDEKLYIGDYLSNINIDTDNVNIYLNKERCVLIPPISITCKNVSCSPTEVIIEYTANKKFGNTMAIDCEHFVIDYSNSGKFSLVERNKDSQSLKIFTSVKPDYPFDKYWCKDPQLSEFTEEQLSIFKKLRKTIALFKSHSKGRMAKFKDKINNRRVCGIGVGKILLDSLLDKKVLYLEGEFYFINPDYMDKHLGLSYDQVKMGILNDKTIQFIRSLKS